MMKTPLEALRSPHLISIHPAKHLCNLPRRLGYRLWGLLPARAQRLIIRIAVPSMTLGVSAVIRDSSGHILLVHHTYRRRAWGLPSGFVRGLEQPAAALARELREELGVAAVVGSLLAADRRGRHLTLFYHAALAAAPVPDGVEIDGFRYVAPDALSAMLGQSRPSWLSAVSRSSTAA